MNYKNYDLRVWDKDGWDSGGETVGWYIMPHEPDKYILGGTPLEEYDILLTPEEVNQLKLEEIADGYSLEDRDLYYDLKEFIETFDVPERVYDLLEQLPE